MESIDFLDRVDGVGGKGTDDLPGQAGALALAALVRGFMENDNLTLFVCKEQAVIFAPRLCKLHEGEKLGGGGGDEREIVDE